MRAGWDARAGADFTLTRRIGNGERLRDRDYDYSLGSNSSRETIGRRRLLLFDGGAVGSTGRVVGHQSRRFAADGDGGAGGEHAARILEPEQAVALGGPGRSVCAHR